jgi:hypothetical protein
MEGFLTMFKPTDSHLFLLTCSNFSENEIRGKSIMVTADHHGYEGYHAKTKFDDEGWHGWQMV